MSSDLVVYEQRPLSAVDIRAQVNLIQEVMKAVMQKGQHYGTVPGCGDKPTLLKPGAEKIMATFRLSADPVVEDLSTSDIMRYRVTCRLSAQSTGIFVGAGVGECSSEEEKYKWRFSVSEAEWNSTPEDRKRIKYKRDGQVNQIRTNPADVANTILKMAKKRALVDAVLTVTAASDIFTQDIEDMPEEMLNGGKGTQPPIQKPQEKAAVTGEEITTGVEGVTLKHGEKNGKPWTLYAVLAGEKYTTFSETLAKEAKRAAENGLMVKLTYDQTEKGRNLKTLVVIEPQEPGSEG